MVQYVEGLPPELERGSFRETDVLEHREIVGPSGRADQTIALHVAEGSGRYVGECRDIEPLVGGWIRGIRADTGRVQPVRVGLNDLATGIPAHGVQRTAALGGEDRGDLPPDYALVREPAAIEELLPSSEGPFVQNRSHQ